MLFFHLIFATTKYGTCLGLVLLKWPNFGTIDKVPIPRGLLSFNYGILVRLQGVFVTGNLIHLECVESDTIYFRKRTWVILTECHKRVPSEL